MASSPVLLHSPQFSDESKSRQRSSEGAVLVKSTLRKSAGATAKAKARSTAGTRPAASNAVRPAKAKSVAGRAATARAPKAGLRDVVPPARISDEERWRLIAERAYARAEARGFREGSPVQDWLDAEAEVDSALGRRHLPR